MLNIIVICRFYWKPMHIVVSCKKPLGLWYIARTIVSCVTHLGHIANGLTM